MHTIYMSLGLAIILGAIIGIERFVAHKTAGIRTYATISMGSALFVIISQSVAHITAGSFDPLRMAAQIVSAAGFLGAGVILHKDNQTLGMTTASGLWASAGIGMACGFGLYKLAAFATIAILFIFVVLWFIESWIEKIEKRKSM